MIIDLEFTPDTVAADVVVQFEKVVNVDLAKAIMTCLKKDHGIDDEITFEIDTANYSADIHSDKVSYVWVDLGEKVSEMAIKYKNLLQRIEITALAVEAEATLKELIKSGNGLEEGLSKLNTPITFKSLEECVFLIYVEDSTLYVYMDNKSSPIAYELGSCTTQYALGTKVVTYSEGKIHIDDKPITKISS